MNKDYRNTRYCPKLTELSNKKKTIKDAVLSRHRKAQDMHTYISDNSGLFKQSFIEAYNGKCSYCGVSIDIIPWKMFEIDHFIPKESPRFNGSKAAAGYIENLVLSCYECNRAKNAFETLDSESHKVNPDGTNITQSFFRDDNFYIRISKHMVNDKTVNDFYKQLKLDSQIHRIDYLLLSMIGLQKKLTDKHSAYSKLSDAITALQRKRNVIR